MRDQSELGAAVEDSAQDPDTAIARDGSILLQARFLQVLEISVFIGFTSYASPDTCNHRLGPRLQICRKILAGNSDYGQLGRLLWLPHERGARAYMNKTPPFPEAFSVPAEE
jgi:hypothetical protein